MTTFSGLLHFKYLYNHTLDMFPRYPFSENQEIPVPDWEVFLRETANAIVQEQTPQRLMQVRGQLYELLTHCIPPDIIMKVRHKESGHFTYKSWEKGDL